jgi:hypothetical protein
MIRLESVELVRTTDFRPSNLSCLLTLSCLILSCLVLSCIAFSCLGLSWFYLHISNTTEKKHFGPWKYANKKTLACLDSACLRLRLFIAFVFVFFFPPLRPLAKPLTSQVHVVETKNTRVGKTISDNTRR